MARRQASTPVSPARRRRKAEAAVARPPATLTPEQIQRVKQHAARQVVADMQAQINQAIAEEQADWQAAAGRPMPMNLRQLVIEAGVAGVSREDIALAQERAEKTGDRFGYDEVKEESTVEKILRAQRVDDETRTRLAVAAATADKPKPSNGEEHNVDGLLLKARKKLAIQKFGNDLVKADAELRILGWTALADAIVELTGTPITSKRLYRHRNNSVILKTYSPFRPQRGGKSKAKRNTTTAVDIAGNAGQLVTASRHNRLLTQEPDPSQDPRSDEQRRQDEAEAQWIEQGRRGTCSSKACRDENPTRFRNGRPWCDDCYAEKFEGITPDVIGIRPR